jgi:hypothetical protein
VIGSAVIPTLIAQRFFAPAHEQPSLSGSEVAAIVEDASEIP